MTRRWGAPKSWRKGPRVKAVSDAWTAGNRPGVAKALELEDDLGPGLTEPPYPVDEPEQKTGT